jgi:oligopeptide/dipeptide ABC transporter ATP-binding protein
MNGESWKEDEAMSYEPDESPLLVIRDLKVHFRGGPRLARAVDGVGLKVRPGETVCLVGESGSGKTVTALSILGLVPMPPGEIAGGSIVFKGRELLGLSEEALRTIRGNQISMVFQEPLTSLNPVFTVGAQIREAIDIHRRLDSVQARARCISLLKDVGIPDAEKRILDYPHQLSGGQRQRVMIAMALACDPDLIIADEPTTALDVTVQAQILSLLHHIKQIRGMSLLYITHDLGVVAGIADWVYVMYCGLIVEQGHVARILKSPRHPYTRGLLASLPTLEKRGRRLYSIPGSVPDPSRRPAGCPFHPRCPEIIDTCRVEFPRLCDYGDGHLARCPVLFERR